MTHPDVVVTGVGPIASTGVGRDSLWEALIGGVDGSHPVEAFDTGAFRTHRACEVDEAQAERTVGGRETPGFERLGKASRLALLAARLAIADAGCAPLPERTGVVLGTTGGEIRVLEQMNEARHEGRSDRIAEDEFTRHPCHMIAVNVARALGSRGPTLVVPTACAAGNYAQAIARHWLRTGKAELVLAGGVEPLSRVAFTGFSRLGAISPDYCRPFDRNRRGLLIGEGAAVLVLESHERARRRGVRPYARLAGCGFSCDAHHMTMPHPAGDGIRLAMKRALRDAALAPADVDYVSAHGTGTRANDSIESAAIRSVFGARASSIPCSSIKSMIGHTMGAAGALESIASVLAIRDDLVPPTTHFQTADPECDLDVVPNEARETKVRVVLNNSFAFGGSNCCLVLSELPA